MNLEVSFVPSFLLPRVLPGLQQYLLKSEAWTRGRATVEDIINFLTNEQMQLWLVYAGDSLEEYGYVITEVKEYPQCKMLVVQYCAGKPHAMKYIEDQMYAVLEKFARSAGCRGIEFFGRPGWGPHARKRGYTVQMVVYEKYLDEVRS